MKGELTVLIFYNFVVAIFGLSYRMLDKDTQGRTSGTYHGRYTRDIRDPELLVPRRVSEDGSFLTFSLPNFYDRVELESRKKRAADAETVDDDLTDHNLHLVLPFNGANHHVELTPNHEFISPDMVIETRGEEATTDLNNGVRFKRGADLQCHYRGHVRGHDNSRAALSLCEGVAGFVQTDHGRFFIEPLAESLPDEVGQHAHMIYKRSVSHGDSHDNQRNIRSCGTTDDWESAWAEEIERKNRQERLAGNGTSSKRAPAASNTHSLHRYVELGVFCDKRFLEYHKGKDYEQYVLTMMNIASDFYHDASVGNQMDVIVVRIVYLEKEEKEIDLSISPDADKTLSTFAAWANKINPKDPKHPNHHDVGVLITRYDICASDADGCGLLGLAYVAAACHPEKAAAINEDAGLTLGSVITHEVGHTLGSGHDSQEDSVCDAYDKDKSSYVMSPFVTSYVLRWSPCSKKFISTFLSSGLGECLNDNSKKPNAKYKFPGMLPGAMYDRAYQCGQTFAGSTACPNKMTICDKLWCLMNDGNDGMCRSKGSTPAEGTKCGENKWCIHQECVEIGKRPAAVHGGWGRWGRMGECSRTCGGGVRTAERECDNPTPQNGGRYCLGERVKFDICNTRPCDESKPSYRALQCSEFDSKTPLADRLKHTWQPFWGPKTPPCRLDCVNEKHQFVNLAPQVKDGTPCQAGTNYICIGGVCRKVGCDWVLDSDVVEDQCGICRGDGTQCSQVAGDYTVTKKRDYQKVVTVPKGSRNIKFVEKGPSTNTLAIKLEKGNKYIINGGHNEDRNGEYPCAGDIAVYSHPEPQKEEIFIHGPIAEDIQLQYVFYNPMENPGLRYSYFVRSGRSSKSPPEYLWDFLTWGPCSAKCGGGTQVTRNCILNCHEVKHAILFNRAHQLLGVYNSDSVLEATCVEHLAGKVGDSFCKDIPRPEPKSRICDSQPCGAKFRVSQWSHCSGCEGKQGEQRRKVQCVKPAARDGGEDVQTDLSACKGKVPKQTRECTGTKACKKKCAKKTRSNSFEDQDHAYGDKRVNLEEQRNNIDRLVDMGVSKYLEKQNPASTERRSKKRNAVANLKNLIDDWAAPSNDATVDGKRDCTGVESKGFTTKKPDTIIKDKVPVSEMVLLEAPILRGIQPGNLSDQAFEEDGDSVGAELDTDKMKVYKGAEAINHMNQPAGAKGVPENVTCEE